MSKNTWTQMQNPSLINKDNKLILTEVIPICMELTKNNKN